MERVQFYIDGFNLYFGIKESGWDDALWLNLKTLCESLLKEEQVSINIKYFTSRVRNNPPKEKRQNTYLDALSSLSNLHIIYGHYQSRIENCRKCGHSYPYGSEKMTDVNIAVELMTDAFTNQYDTAILISGDSDLVPPVKAIKSIFPAKKIVVAFPPNRFNNIMKLAADGHVFINRTRIINCQLPDSIFTAQGHMLERPATWK